MFPTQIRGPVTAIGDVHGQVEQLVELLDRLRCRSDFSQRWLLFIGDFVDRGPDPSGALEILADLMVQHPRTAAVMGNHELAMASALGLTPSPDYANWSSRWLDHYGAESTFASYDVEFGDLARLRESLPDTHAALIADLPWCIEHPDYLFVHAGLDPDQPFEIQRAILRDRDFTLSRPAWLCSKSFADSAPPPGCPQTVVSGHVPHSDVQFGDRRILIDTTGGVGGELSCVLLPENIVISSGGSAPSTAATGRRSRGLFSFWR